MGGPGAGDGVGRGEGCEIAQVKGVCEGGLVLGLVAGATLAGMHATRASLQPGRGGLRRPTHPDMQVKPLEGTEPFVKALLLSGTSKGSGQRGMQS
jgi:hypothetical protein